MKNERFEECFREYQDFVFRFALSKTGDQTVSEEITQKAFVALYENLDRVETGMEKAWLLRCTKNALIDYYRKNRIRKEHLSPMDVLADGNVLAEGYTDSCEERLYNLALVEEIFREVRRINENWFEALTVFFVEGLSYEEAARELNVEPGVLKGRIYRARQYIRQNFLEKYKAGK